jgi:hypothetical protein
MKALVGAQIDAHLSMELRPVVYDLKALIQQQMAIAMASLETQIDDRFSNIAKALIPIIHRITDEKLAAATRFASLSWLLKDY